MLLAVVLTKSFLLMKKITIFKNIVFGLLFISPLYMFSQNQDANINSNTELGSKDFKIINNEKEVLSKRTSSSKTYLLSNNQYKSQIFRGAIHYFDKGLWKDIDLSIQKSKTKKGFYENRTNTIQSFFPESLSDNTKVKLQNNENYYYLGNIFSFSLEDDPNKEGKQIDYSINLDKSKAELMSPQTIKYDNGNPLGYLTYDVDYNSFKQKFILKELPKEVYRSSERFFSMTETIELPKGWTVVADGKAVVNTLSTKSQLILKNDRNEIAFVIPLPEIYEEKNPSIILNASGIMPHSFTVTKLGNEYKVKVSIPIAWLTSKDRSYPVVIDPTTTLPGSWGGWQNGENFVEGNPTDFVFTGFRNPNNTYRSWTQFDVSSIPDESTVDSVVLEMFMNDTGNQNTTETILVNDVTGDLGPYNGINQTAFSDFADGNYTSFEATNSGTYRNIVLGTNANSDLESRLVGNLFQVAFTIDNPTTWKRFSSNLNNITVVYDSNTPPNAICQDIIVQLDANGEATIVAADVDGGSSDSDGAVTLSIDQNTFSCGNIGTTVTVTLTVTNEDGQTATCTANVTVEDSIDPMLTCAAAITVSNDPGECGANVMVPFPVITDNCGVFEPSFISAITPLNFDGDGELIDTPASLTGITTVTEDVVIEINYSGDFTSSSECFELNGPDGSQVFFGCDLVDDGDCSSVINPTFTIPQGVWNNWVAIYGNSFTFTLLANSRVDDGGCGDEGPANNFYQLSEKKGTIRLINDFNGVENASGFYPVGTTQVMFTATDQGGNSVSCSVAITVNDTEAPVITCPDNITVINDLDTCGAIVTFDAPFATDNCDNYSNDLESVLASFASNSTTITSLIPDPYDFELDDGLNGTSIGDGGDDMYDDGNFVNTNIASEIQYSDNTIINSSDFGLSGRYFTLKVPNMWLLAADLDNIDSFEIDGDLGADGSGVADGFVATITVGEKNYTIFVKRVREDFFDIEERGNIEGRANLFHSDPSVNHLIIIPENGNANHNFSTDTDEDQHEITGLSQTNRLYYLLFAGTNSGFVDNATMTNIATEFLQTIETEEAPFIQTAGLPSGSEFPVGTTTNTFEITDTAGNTATCSFDVTVEDNTAPVIACAMDVETSTNPDSCFATVNFGDPLVTDNCGNDDLTITQTVGMPSGSMFPVGVSQIAFEVTDTNGNTSQCSFTITVTDETPPVAVCQDITVELDETGNVTITASKLNGGSTDNCNLDTSMSSIDIDTFGCADVGDNTVTLTVSDSSGNTATCTATVTVMDNTAPVVTCNDITVALGADGTVTLDPTLLDGGSSDACGITTLTASPAVLDCGNLGVTEVTLTATDVNGNSSSCTALVTVEDNIAPTLVCQEAVIELGPDGTATIDPIQLLDLSNPLDNCGVEPLMTDVTTVDCSDVGSTITVTVTAMDASGNTSSCTTTITVVDVTGPTFDQASLPVGPIVRMINPATGIYRLEDFTVGVTATDGCSELRRPIAVSQSPFAGTELDEGTYDITITAMDEAGNDTDYVFELQVQPALGVEDANLSSLTLYPNPASDRITLSNPNGLQLDKAAIYDLQGRLIQHIDLTDMLSEKTIDVSSLQSAAYMFVISSENGMVTKQIIKE